MDSLEQPRHPNAAAGLLLAVSASLNAFWILNLIKEGNVVFKKAITVHAGMGPLSGLYLYSALIGLLFFALLPWILGRRENPRLAHAASAILFISAALLFVLTFPPVFKAALGE
jgi:hypothetical protein